MNYTQISREITFFKVFVKRNETVWFCKLEQLIKITNTKMVAIGFKCRKRYN